MQVENLIFPKKEKITMKTALQLYSIRDAVNGENVNDIFASLAGMGYQGIELAGLYGMTAAQIKDAADAAGLSVVSAHISYADLMGNREEWIDNLKTLDCPQAVIPYMQACDLPGSDNWAEVEGNIRGIAKDMKAAGILLAYHNHDFEFEKVDGEYKLDMLYTIFDESELKTQIDTCWVNVGGENPVTYVEKYAGRCPTVHLKDFTGVKNGCPYALIGIEGGPTDTGTFEFRPCGSGVQDFPAIIEASVNAGAEWCIVEQDSPSMGKSSLECAEMSIKYLKGLVK